MPRTPNAKAKRKASAPAPPSAPTQIPAAEALSFLRETRGVSTWTAEQLAASLKIKASEADRVIAVLQMQGYVNEFKADEWMTTFAGETVSGSKPPRYTRDRIEEALSALRDRIDATNRDRKAAFQITQAIAFGDFMIPDRTRLQSPEIGIQLTARRSADSSSLWKQEKLFLAQLRNKIAAIQLRTYEPWMSARTHRNLLAGSAISMARSASALQ